MLLNKKAHGYILFRTLKFLWDCKNNKKPHCRKITSFLPQLNKDFIVLNTFKCPPFLSKVPEMVKIFIIIFQKKDKKHKEEAEVPNLLVATEEDSPDREDHTPIGKAEDADKKVNI